MKIHKAHVGGRPGEHKIYTIAGPASHIRLIVVDNRIVGEAKLLNGALYQMPDGHRGDRLGLLIRNWLQRGQPGAWAKPVALQPAERSAGRHSPHCRRFEWQNHPVRIEPAYVGRVPSGNRIVYLDEQPVGFLVQTCVGHYRAPDGQTDWQIARLVRAWLDAGANHTNQKGSCNGPNDVKSRARADRRRAAGPANRQP